MMVLESLSLEHLSMKAPEHLESREMTLVHLENEKTIGNNNRQ